MGPCGNSFSRVKKVTLEFYFPGKSSNNMKVFNWLTPTFSSISASPKKQGCSPQKSVSLCDSLCVELPGPCVLWLKCYTNSSYLFYCTADWNVWTKSAGQQPACVSIHGLPVWLNYPHHPIIYMRAKNVSMAIYFESLCA